MALNIVRACAVVFASILAAACSSIPLTSALKLSQLNAETLDLSQVEAALRMQDVYRVTEDSVRLTLILSREGGVRREETFLLEERDASTSRLLAKRMKEGFLVQRFALAPTDGPRMNAFRDAAGDLPRDGANSFSLNVNFGFCLTEGAPADAPAPLTTVFVKTSVEKDFITLIKEGAHLGDEPGGAGAAPQPCAEA